jgi:hypothetical protein
LHPTNPHLLDNPLPQERSRPSPVRLRQLALLRHYRRLRDISTASLGEVSEHRPHCYASIRETFSFRVSPYLRYFAIWAGGCSWEGSGRDGELTGGVTQSIRGGREGDAALARGRQEEREAAVGFPASCYLSLGYPVSVRVDHQGSRHHPLAEAEQGIAIG